MIQRTSGSKTRRRALGGGKKGVLGKIEEKLVFILFYTHVRPVYKIMGKMFGASSISWGREWVLRLLPVLTASVPHPIVLPRPRLYAYEAILAKFPGMEEVFTDGVAAPLRYPKKSSQAV